jgi:hypothetical protein
MRATASVPVANERERLAGVTPNSAEKTGSSSWVQYSMAKRGQAGHEEREVGPPELRRPPAQITPTHLHPARVGIHVRKSPHFVVELPEPSIG